MFGMATRAEQILAKKSQILSQEEEKRRVDKERQRQEEMRIKLEDEERERQEGQRRILEIRSVLESLGVMSIIDDLVTGIPGSTITYNKNVINNSLYEYTFFKLTLYLNEGKSEWITVEYTPAYMEVLEESVFAEEITPLRPLVYVLFSGGPYFKKTEKHGSELKVCGFRDSKVVGKDGVLDDLIAEALAHPDHHHESSYPGNIYGCHVVSDL